MGVIKGDIRNLDYASYGTKEANEPPAAMPSTAAAAAVSNQNLGLLTYEVRE